MKSLNRASLAFCFALGLTAHGALASETKPAPPSPQQAPVPTLGAAGPLRGPTPQTPMSMLGAAGPLRGPAPQTPMSMLGAAGPLRGPTPQTPSPAQTPAAACVNAEIIVLHGTNDGSGIDSKIGKIPELSKPPFSSYNSYKLLDRPKVNICKGKEQKVKLPNERELAVMLKDILAPKKKDETTRYVVNMSINKPGGNTFLPLLEVNAKASEWFFVAGQSYKGGMLAFGIKVLP